MVGSSNKSVPEMAIEHLGSTHILPSRHGTGAGDAWSLFWAKMCSLGWTRSQNQIRVDLPSGYGKS